MICGDKIPNLNLCTINHGCQPSWDPWTSITTELQDYGAEVELVLEKILSQPKTGIFCEDSLGFSKVPPKRLGQEDESMHCIEGDHFEAGMSVVQLQGACCCINVSPVLLQ